MTRNLRRLAGAVQRNCDISDARHAGDYGLCTFLLRMREYYRWEMELPFSRRLAKDDLGDWLDGRERLWSGIEEDGFARLPLGRAGLDPFATARANRTLLPRGLVYSAGYGRFGKPVFFLGRLLDVQERAGLKVIVSSCEYARELAAPPAMLLGRTVFVRRESVRRALWERLEEWRWRKLDAPAVARPGGLRAGDGHRARARAPGRPRDRDHDPARDRRGQGRGAARRHVGGDGSFARAHAGRAVRARGARPARRLHFHAARAHRARRSGGAALLLRHLRRPAARALSRGPRGLPPVRARRRSRRARPRRGRGARALAATARDGSRSILRARGGDRLAARRQGALTPDRSPAPRSAR